ncbi:T9SS type A sorting domain-containing protein, partial [Salegentibacter maritimus]|uniref:T9SS type A sorting domain-containing protein n=1 Tax=Salegentibacter maritimus TaxID=2794347 RepID=UPI0018E4D64D
APTAKDNCSELTATTSDPLTYNEIGSYVITWSFDDGNGNTTIQKQKVIVEPSPLNAVTFHDASFEYNGDAHSLEVKNLPETASVEYSIVPETGIQNGAIKAGVYTVTANLFSGIETCPDAQLTATLTIDKAEAEISADAVQTFVYDGTVKNIVANLNHSETELTYTPQKGFIEPGTYEITVNSVETENYFATSKEVTLVIEKAEFTGVSFADNTEAFVYNGTEHSIFVSGLPEGATVEYTNNGQTNAGTYLVTAKVSKPGYKDLVLTANMVINKASQSITFDELEDRNQLSDEHFQLNAVATSGLPVMYSYTYESENPAATVGPRGFVRILGGGQITITARQEGNQNYEAATPVVRTLTINGSEARLVSASINGTTYNDPNIDIYYLIGCGSSENEIQIELEPNQGSSIDSQNIFTVNTPTPGIYRRTLVVTSGDGNVSTTYNIIIEKNFNFEDIVIQKFNNVLLVNNNPETNGGYKFVSFRWYKNGSVIGNDQYYSVGNNTGDQLDADASYYVVLETEDGEVLRTCISSVQLKSSLNVSLAPNPVNSGGTMELLTDFPEEELETMHLSIHTLNGGLIQQMKSNSKSTNITLPYNLEIGVYILKIETKSIYKSLKFIVK